MKSKIIGSLVVAGTLLQSVQAFEISPFGKLGTMGNFGFGANTLPDQNATGYVGVTGHIGLDFKISGFRFGAGAMGAFAPLSVGAGGSLINNVFVGDNALFAKPWVELSDLYVGYQGFGFDFLIGRYDASKILASADFVGGHNQGVIFSHQSQYLGIWLTWVNDWLQNGYNAGANLGSESRYGMDLIGLGGYSSSWQNFNFKNELFAVGLDFKFGSHVSFSPYAHYWLRSAGDNVLQAGGRLILDFEFGALKTLTTARALWSNIARDNINGFMWQIDEELLFFNMLKLGGGYLSIGNVGLNNTSLIDRTRFYGQYLYPFAYNGTGLVNRSYLNANVNTWYVFTGLKFGKMLDLDILYADGDYKEFSSIVNVNIVDSRDLLWSVGGGYVSDGFRNAHTALFFTKLQF